MALIPALAIAGAAEAQTVTNCRPDFSGFQCETTQDRPPPTREPYRDTYAETVARYKADQAAEDAANLHRRVGAMIAAGRCEDAKQTALMSGDLALARDVAAVCATPTSGQ